MIGGNTVLELLVKGIGTKNPIGESIGTHTVAHTITGWLDLASGNSDRKQYNAKIEESTHVFICDYKTLTVTPSQCTARIDGQLYDVTYIDDPMGLHLHLEIFLKYTGA